MPPQALFDVSKMDFDRPLYDLMAIRSVNPQRHEMEQLTAVVHVDEAGADGFKGKGAVGYKDVTDREFWVQGHMPGFPLMPGVILCEAAAQLAGFYARKFDILGGDYLGFGGMDEVRFRAPVFPGCRLILMARLVDLRPKRRAEFAFQGFVKDRMVFSGSMIGVPISRSHPVDEG